MSTSRIRRRIEKRKRARHLVPQSDSKLESPVSSSSTNILTSLKNATLLGAKRVAKAATSLPGMAVATLTTSLPSVFGHHDDSVDPFHKGCTIAQRIMVPIYNSTATMHAAWVYCEDFFKVHKPFSHEKGWVPKAVIELFQSQKCAELCHHANLTYNWMCSSAGTVWKSGEYFATHVIAENITCVVDGFKNFNISAEAAHCFHKLTLKAGKLTDDIQQDLITAYEKLDAETKTKITVGAFLAVGLTAFTFFIRRKWHQEISQGYAPIGPPPPTSSL